MGIEKTGSNAGAVVISITPEQPAPELVRKKCCRRSTVKITSAISGAVIGTAASLFATVQLSDRAFRPPYSPNEIGNLTVVTIALQILCSIVGYKIGGWLGNRFCSKGE